MTSWSSLSGGGVPRPGPWIKQRNDYSLKTLGHGLCHATCRLQWKKGVWVSPFCDIMKSYSHNANGTKVIISYFKGIIRQVWMLTWTIIEKFRPGLLLRNCAWNLKLLQLSLEAGLGIWILPILKCTSVVLNRYTDGYTWFEINVREEMRGATLIRRMLNNNWLPGI